MDITRTQVQEAARQLRLIVDRPAIATQELTKGSRFARKELRSNLPDGYVAIVDNRNKTTYTRMPLETFKTLLTIYEDQIGRKGDAPKLLKKIMVNGQLFTNSAKLLSVVQRHGESIPYFEAKPIEKVKKKPTPKPIILEETDTETDTETEEDEGLSVELDEDEQEYYIYDGVTYIHNFEDDEILDIENLEPVGELDGAEIIFFNDFLAAKHRRHPKYKPT